MTEPEIDIDIRIDAAPWRAAAAAHEATVRRAALAALAGIDGPVEVSVLLTGDDDIAALNERWRGKAGPTNVLSFPGDELGDAAGDEAGAGGRAPGEPLMLGDIAIAWETLDREAARDGIPFADHLAHLVVHGVLHLRGYDHETDDEAAEMEGLESALLAGLGVPDPYRDDPYCPESYSDDPVSDPEELESHHG